MADGATRAYATDDVPMRGWGLPAPGELDRVVIVSPHLDDAVLGCGNFMAAHPGVVRRDRVRGQPAAYPTDPMRKWDVQSGFAPGDDVMEFAPRTRTTPRSRCSTRRRSTSSFVEHTYNPGDDPVAPEVIAEVLAPALGRARRRRS